MPIRDLEEALAPPMDPSKSIRHKCSACYKEYKKKEHLIEHMRVTYHSTHQPKCNVCKKHCKSYESVREHLKGPLPKAKCADIFSTRGCNLCLEIFDTADMLGEHQRLCRLDAASTPLMATTPRGNCSQTEVGVSCSTVAIDKGPGPEVIALDCEMVGGGSDGSLDLCARVCLIGEDENVIFHSYVKPLIPVTNYRYEVTGITEEHLADAMPLTEVRRKLEEILYNGETLTRARMKGGKARLLLGHDLEHDLECLKMNYPDILIRDTAKYQPLMRTNLISHSLKYLTKTYLGYDIQTGVHDPYEDCVASLRLYKRMRSQPHQNECLPISNDTYAYAYTNRINPFDSLRFMELEKLSADALLEMSVSKYRCWCLDTKRTLDS